MKLFFYVIVVTILHHCMAADNPDVGKNTIELANGYGYPIESHRVITEDGFKLQMHRIPHGRNQAQGIRKPVILFHGLGGSSETFVTSGLKSLAYILADTGLYDVWMPNARGTYSSRNHLVYNPNIDPRFWDFSYHEIGYYDAASCIDYILAKTNFNKLYYIGHSQGGTAFLVLTSMRPNYNTKIELFIGLAPASYIKYVGSPVILAIAKQSSSLNYLLNIAAPFELTRKSILNNLFGEIVCDERTPVVQGCKLLIFLIVGYSTQIEDDMVPVIAGIAPAGSSVKQYFHFAQGVTTNDFCQYDYGPIVNQIKYDGQAKPPCYDLNKITTKVAILSAANDTLAKPKDIETLIQHLGKETVIYHQVIENFAHVDFVWGKDADKLCHIYIVELLSQHPI